MVSSVLIIFVFLDYQFQFLFSFLSMNKKIKCGKRTRRPHFILTKILSEVSDYYCMTHTHESSKVEVLCDSQRKDFMRAYDESHVLPNSRQLLRQKMTKLVPPTVLILLIRPIIFKVYTSLYRFIGPSTSQLT